MGSEGFQRLKILTDVLLVVEVGVEREVFEFIVVLVLAVEQGILALQL